MNKLCGDRWLETGSPFLNTSDTMAENNTQAAEAASDFSCELCGSSCNERDELIKCEREINNLRLEVSRLRSVIEREAE